MLETSLRLLFSAAHPQKGVPWARHQEGRRSPRQQAKQWWRRQWPWEFFQGHPQQGWQSGRCQLLGLGRHPGLPAFTTPQWMGDLAPSQVPQEGFRQQAEEDKQCKPGPAKRQTQGVQGWGAPLNRHPADVYILAVPSNKNFVT